MLSDSEQREELRKWAQQVDEAGRSNQFIDGDGVSNLTDWLLKAQEEATRKEIAEWFSSPCENCDHEAYYINGYSRGHCDICLYQGLNELAQGLELP